MSLTQADLISLRRAGNKFAAYGTTTLSSGNGIVSTHSNFQDAVKATQTPYIGYILSDGTISVKLAAAADYFDFGKFDRANIP